MEGKVGQIVLLRGLIHRDGGSSVAPVVPLL
jgi:hypothetical protein